MASIPNRLDFLTHNFSEIAGFEKELINILLILE